MNDGREKRPSEKTLDVIFQLIRSLDVEIWTGEKYRLMDIEGNVTLIKKQLDIMLQEFKQEMGLSNGSSNNNNNENSGRIPKKEEIIGKPWIDPIYKNKEWNITPIIVPENKDSK